MSFDYDRLRDAFIQVDVPFPWKVDARPSKHHPEVTNFQVVGLDDSVVVEMEAEGEYAEVVERDLDLIALAPDMARELLRLRDGVQDIRRTCARTADICRSSEYPEEQAVAGNLESVAHQLTGLLDGDTE